MVTDAFSTLGLPAKLAFEEGEIEAQWRNFSKSAHPDGEAGDANIAANINQAYELLRNAGSRLRHWLELQGVEIPRNASIDEELMSVFSNVGAMLSEVDQFLEKKTKATSAIAKALLADEEFSVQKKLQECMGNLKFRIESVEAQFPKFEKDSKSAIAGLEKLRFLEKWNQQCQNRLVAMMSL